MVYSCWPHYFLVISLLLRRELTVLAQSWQVIAGSTIVFSSMMALSAGYFMPQMGMDSAFAIPLFLGSFLTTCLSLGYTCAIDIGYDLQSPRLALYYYALPVPVWVVIVGLICSLMARMMVVSVPVLLLGLTLIWQWPVFAISWGAAISMVLLCALFNALLFLILAYGCSLSALMGNVWPRFISPLFAFGCVFYTWKPIAAQSWYFSRLMLCSPMTYCCEGLRSALLGGSAYISSSLCIGFLTVLNLCLFLILRRVLVHAINPVVAGGK